MEEESKIISDSGYLSSHSEIRYINSYSDM
jgi:hypothetical protein